MQLHHARARGACTLHCRASAAEMLDAKQSRASCEGAVGAVGPFISEEDTPEEQVVAAMCNFMPVSLSRAEGEVSAFLREGLKLEPVVKFC